MQGNKLIDACGQPFMVRGVEQVFGLGISINGSWLTLADEIMKSNVNAVRVLPNLSQLSVSDVDSIIGRFAANSCVVFVSPGDPTWFNQNDVKTMLAKYRGWLVVDAFQEPNYDDSARWLIDTKAAIQTVREYGYTDPITILSNLYGRDLPTSLANGAEVVAVDPTKNTIIGWQAYWGSSNYYQTKYGMTLTQGVQRSAPQSFPIKLGIDHITDGTTETLDYTSVMAAAQSNQLGWLWWDWWNPFDSTDNGLSTNGTVASLTSVGAIVVNTDPNSIKNTAKKACRP